MTRKFFVVGIVLLLLFSTGCTGKVGPAEIESETIPPKTTAAGYETPSPTSPAATTTPGATVPPETTNAPTTPTATEFPIQTPVELTGEYWLNSEPLKLADLKGKVVMIFFWSNTCPRCQAAKPEINKWYDAYHDQGFEIIASHIPALPDDRKPEYMEELIEEWGMTYPVILDNYFENWNNYKAEFTPTFYLIDRKGNIRYFHQMSSGSEETEAMIKKLVEESA